MNSRYCVQLILFLTFGVAVAVKPNLNCNGEADVVLAIPASRTQVPQGEFDLYEDFLIDMVNYYNVKKDRTNVGLILYGSEPMVMNGLMPGLNKRDIFTRISLMTQRELYHFMDDGSNVVKAIDSIIKVHADSKRNVPKVGVILTYGSDDLSGMTGKAIRGAVMKAGDRARAAGITMFAVTAGGAVPGFEHIAMDKCRLYSLGTNSNLRKLLPYIASGTCYVFNWNVKSTPAKCFPVVLKRKPLHLMKCPPPTSGFFPDKNNCAYFLQCTPTKRYRKKCPGGTLFDEQIKRCNHKEFVTCWSKIKCPRPTGLFRHPHDCGKYLNCFANIPYVQSCPAGLHFNMAMSYCDFPSNAMCAIGGNKGHGNRRHGKKGYGNSYKKMFFDFKTLLGI